jgi:hypothetical protein
MKKSKFTEAQIAFVLKQADCALNDLAYAIRQAV